MQYKNDHCLRWALRSDLFPTNDNVDRRSKYHVQDGLDVTEIDAPTPISKIVNVEKQNDLGISVFGWDKCVKVHRLSKQPADMPRINLLLEEKADKFQHAWIKNINCLAL